MASSSIIQHTAFPRLDDLFSATERERNGQTTHKKLAFSFTTNWEARPKCREDILRSYSHFIASYTGQSEITFQYALRTQIQKSVEPHIVRLRTSDDDAASCSDTTDDYVLDSINHSQEEDMQAFDFGLEIVADVNNFESAEAPALLSCVSIFFIMMGQNHMTDTDSHFLFNTTPWRWL